MGILKKTFIERDAWWMLVPDQSIFASGGKTDGQVLNLAARRRDGRWIMVYLAAKDSVGINMNKLDGEKEADAFWIDPRTGDEVLIGTFANTGVRSFTTPEGWEDALLVIEPTSRRGRADKKR